MELFHYQRRIKALSIISGLMYLAQIVIWGLVLYESLGGSDLFDQFFPPSSTTIATHPPTTEMLPTLPPFTFSMSSSPSPPPPTTASEEPIKETFNLEIFIEAEGDTTPTPETTIASTAPTTLATAPEIVFYVIEENSTTTSTESWKDVQIPDSEKLSQASDLNAFTTEATTVPTTTNSIIFPTLDAKVIQKYMQIERAEMPEYQADEPKFIRKVDTSTKPILDVWKGTSETPGAISVTEIVAKSPESPETATKIAGIPNRDVPIIVTEVMPESETTTTLPVVSTAERVQYQTPNEPFYEVPALFGIPEKPQVPEMDESSHPRPTMDNQEEVEGNYNGGRKRGELPSFARELGESVFEYPREEMPRDPFYSSSGSRPGRRINKRSIQVNTHRFLQCSKENDLVALYIIPIWSIILGFINLSATVLLFKAAKRKSYKKTRRWIALTSLTIFMSICSLIYLVVVCSTPMGQNPGSDFPGRILKGRVPLFLNVFNIVVTVLTLYSVTKYLQALKCSQPRVSLTKIHNIHLQMAKL